MSKGISITNHNKYKIAYEKLIKLRDKKVQNDNEATLELFDICAWGRVNESDADIIARYIVEGANYNDPTCRFINNDTPHTKLVKPMTTFFCAIRNYHNEFVEFLIGLGANLKGALHVATLYNNLIVLKLLIAHRANINEINNNGYKPLELTTTSKWGFEAVKILLENGAEISKSFLAKASYYPIETANLIMFAGSVDEIFYEKNQSVYSQSIKLSEEEKDFIFKRLKSQLENRGNFWSIFKSKYKNDLQKLNETLFPKDLVLKIHNLTIKLDEAFINLAVEETPFIAMCEKIKGNEVSPTPLLLIERNSIMSSQERNKKIYEETIKFYNDNPAFKVPGNYTRQFMCMRKNDLKAFLKANDEIAAFLESLLSSPLMSSKLDSGAIHNVLTIISSVLPKPCDENSQLVGEAGSVTFENDSVT